MVGSARVWLAGLVGFSVGIAIAELRPRSAFRDPGTSADRPATAGERIRPDLDALSQPDTATSRVAGSEARSVVESSDPSRTQTEARVQTMVYGRLLEQDGMPIRDSSWARVYLVARTGQRWNADASQGGYAFAGLPLGTYDVVVRAHAHRTAQETLELSLDQPEMKKDFRLSRAVNVRVQVVTPGGQPFFEAFRSFSSNWREIMAAQDILPIATQDPPGGRSLEFAGSRNDPIGVGQFQQSDPTREVLPPACTGILILQCDLPVYASLVLGQAVLQTKQVAPGAQEVVFVLTPEDVHASLGSLQVQVLDATTSAPIREAYVTLHGGLPDSRSLERIHRAETDAQGVARIAPALAGRFTLLIAKGGSESWTRKVEIEPGVLNDLGTVVLGAGTMVEVHVVDGLGNPTRANFLLSEISDGARANDSAFRRFLTSDPAGTMKLFGLGRQRYVLRSSDYEAWNVPANSETPWISGNVVIDPAASSDRPLEVRLQPAVPLVIRVEGVPANKLGFLVIDAQGLPLVENRFSDPGPRRLQLPAGSYRVDLCDAESKVLAERSVTLASEPVELSIGP
jgi:hypothetical protein